MTKKPDTVSSPLGRVLTADEILKADDIKRELMNVPEWGGHIYVRGLTAKERDQFDIEVIEARADGGIPPNVRARYAVLGIVDDAGRPIFQPDHAEALGEKSAAIIDAVFARVQRLSKITAADVKELTKN